MLDSARLATAIKNNIITAFGSPDNVNLQKYCTALASAIIEEITAHASLSVTYQDGQYLPTGQGNQMANQDVERTTTVGSVS